MIVGLEHAGHLSSARSPSLVLVPIASGKRFSRHVADDPDEDDVTNSLESVRLEK